MNVRKKTTLLLACAFLLFASCKKDNVQTQGQINAAKLQSLINSSNFTSFTVFNFATDAVETEGDLASVSGDGFIYISSKSPSSGGTPTFFNLETLKAYQVFGTSLDLYF
jgi:hypothetical protein